jgi:hypothetical protein
MTYKKIIQRAEKERRLCDHIAWDGVCTRCGAVNKRFGDEVVEEFGDFRIDLRDEDVKCRRSGCHGRIRWIGRMPHKKALHQNDIRRR